MGSIMKYRILNIRTSYSIIFLTLVFWAFFAFFTMSSIISSQKSYEKLINISGEQRMLSQKTALIVHKVYETSDIKFIKELQNLIKLMKDDHQFLINNLPSSHMKSIYFGETHKIDARVKDYFKLLDSFIEDTESNIIAHILNNSFDLLPHLNYVVNEFEKESAGKIKELQEREILILVGTLFTLLLEVFFIMMPTLRAIKESKKSLEDYNKKLEEEVAEKTKMIAYEHSLNKNYLDTMNSLMVVLDIDANIVMMNRFGVNKLGVSLEEIIGKNWFEIGILPENELLQAKDRFKKIVAEEIDLSNKTFESSLCDKDGVRYLFAWSISLLKENGKTISVVSSGIDITKEKNQERIINEKNKLASMGEMIENIAHQWRQPLSVISISASGAKVKKELGFLDDDTFYKYMDNVLEQSEYLSKTIDTFRDFLKEKKEKKEVILQERINKALKVIEPSLTNNYIQLINNINEHEPIKINLVIGELSEVIINIINNSKDAIKENNIQNPWIKIDLEKNEDHIIISIEDNAKGIPEDILDKIFDPYFTTKHKSQGTGLGLHISYKIVTQSLHGELYAKNSENGAVFYIKLPIK